MILEDLIYDYLVLLQDKHGIVRINDVKPCGTEKAKGLMFKIVSLSRQPTRIGRFHELVQIRDKIRSDRIRNQIHQLSRGQLEEQLYKKLVETSYESYKYEPSLVYQYDSDDDTEAITIVLRELPESYIILMIKELSTLPDYYREQFAR